MNVPRPLTFCCKCRGTRCRRLKLKQRSSRDTHLTPDVESARYTVSNDASPGAETCSQTSSHDGTQCEARFSWGCLSGRPPDDVTGSTHDHQPNIRGTKVQLDACIPASRFRGHPGVHGGALFGVPKVLPATGFACNVLASVQSTINGTYYCENK